MPGPILSVIVVSYNTREKLAMCLEAVGFEYETIVVDNGSTDGSPELVQQRFPHVKLISMESNVGFGRANNIGMDAATHPIVLLLNSDCYAQAGAISILAEAFEDPKVIAAGGKLLNPDGSLQESVAGPLTLGAVFLEQSFLDALFRRFAPSRSYWRTRWALHRAARDPEGRCEVPQVMGACLMMRPVERFDERFFLYCEDTELCRRLEVHGRIVYSPNAVFTHELGSSSTGDRWRSVARYNYGKELYFRIHFGQLQSLACLSLDRFGALLRLLVWTVLLRPPKIRLFWRVLTCPIAGPSGS